MSEKLCSADAVEMGIDKHMVASLCRLENNAISVSLVCNSFSCMDMSSFGCGGLYLKPPKFEHISVAVITFFPFLLCKYFLYQLVAYCVCFKMIYKKSI